jgi:dehydro coenzyme F420 reductase / coenzyme F420-0:L-glutamate ligase / coenzyme F420-1:gamma-L-glutamate ligase
VTVRIEPITGLPEVRPGDDLAGLLAEPLHELGVEGDDVVVVTQKIVSKAEGRVVSLADADLATWIARETVRIVARRGDLLIVETRHGFVCANAGVDASNVDDGTVSLLPQDPDASAAGIREGLLRRLGVACGVVVTDTFGRPWRAGVLNVAIGCAGVPALIDLRGSSDDRGRALVSTVVALSDEIAAASGLVMGKAARVPAALIHGLEGPPGPPGRARDLVRPPDEDLFRTGTIDP